MSTFDCFIDVAKKHFSFLQNDFGAAEPTAERDETGAYVVFQTATTGVRVCFEPEAGGIFVMLCRADDGRLPPYAEWFSFDDLLTAQGIRKETELNTREPDPSEAVFGQILFNISASVQEDAAQVLAGDFSLEERVRSIQSARE